MNNIEQLKENIRQYIRQNGNREITGEILQEILLAMVDELADGGVIDTSLSLESENPVQNKAIKAALDEKVDTATGMGLSQENFTTALKNKLNAMPNITNYDAANDRITIGGKTYQLTEYVPIPDYYIGWTSGTKSAFAALNESQLKQLSTSYLVANNPTYQHACTNIIFFVMFKTDKAPKNGSLVAGGLSSPISAADFLAGGDCPHEPVTIDGTTYKIYGIRNSELVGENNIITINFN